MKCKMSEEAFSSCSNNDEVLLKIDHIQISVTGVGCHEYARKAMTAINNHDKLIEALKPLANLDLTGVRGHVVYQRNDTFISRQEVLSARELLKSIK